VILFHLLYPGIPWPTRWTGRFQSGAGHLPCERLTQCWRIVGLARLVVGGKHVLAVSCLLLAMMRGRSVSFVWLQTESLVMKSYHFMALGQFGTLRTLRCVILYASTGLACVTLRCVRKVSTQDRCVACVRCVAFYGNRALHSMVQ